MRDEYGNEYDEEDELRRAAECPEGEDLTSWLRTLAASYSRTCSAWGRLARITRYCKMCRSGIRRDSLTGSYKTFNKRVMQIIDGMQRRAEGKEDRDD